MDGWTAGQTEGNVGQDGGHGHEGQDGQVRRVGTGGHERAARA